MIKVKEQDIAIEGVAVDILSEFGLLTAQMFKTQIPEDMIFRTMKLALDLAGVDIMKLITCDLRLTENLKQAIEDYKKEKEREE